MSFTDWMLAGFRGIIPVIPPDGTLSPLSKISDRELGKIPGRRRSNGMWTGLPGWQNYEESIADGETWDEWYSRVPSIGLRARHFPGVDIDCTDPELAQVCQEIAERELGVTAVRVRSNTSKRLLIYQTEAPFRRMRLWFRRGDEKPHLVEILGDGQQYLVEGIHPSGVPYEWEGGAPEAHECPLVTLDQASAFLTALAGALEGLGLTIEWEGAARLATAHGSVSQGSLEGSVETVRAAVKAIPNTTDLFPGRDDYLRMGYAIKAALPNDEEEGFEIWWEWCARWEGNHGTMNEERVARADWDRMVPPYSVGVNWILDHARAHGFSTAEDEFNDGLVELLPEPEQAPVEVNKSGAIPYSDAWIAGRFLARHADRLRYSARLGGWFSWDGTRWAPDGTGRAAALVAEVCRDAGRHALANIENVREAESIAKYCGSDRGRRNVLSYLTIAPEIAVPVEAFDADIWALNTPAGIVNLKTGELSAPDPARLFTRCVAVAPKAIPTPKWFAFLNEATGGDVELELYLQRLAGYALTGSTREHVLAFFWGPGGNGKGVFLNTLVRLLGSYAAVAPMDTFTASRYDRHPTELAALFGARLVTAQETQEGRAWDEAKVKSITGGDPISARYMRQDFFIYQPQFKLLFAGNHKPRIMGVDDAMRRRFHMVPFTTRPKKRNEELLEDLEAEWSGILQWAIEGCLQWQKVGLNPPAAIIEATSAYFADEDPVGRWLAERTSPAEAGIETRELFADWKLWCLERNERPGSERGFLQALLTHGLQRWSHPTTRRRGVSGVSLRAAPGDLPPLEGSPPA